MLSGTQIGCGVRSVVRGMRLRRRISAHTPEKTAFDSPGLHSQIVCYMGRRKRFVLLTSFSRSQARARSHSRMTVRSERFITAAVSSTLNPPKNRNSIVGSDLNVGGLQVSMDHVAIM